MDQETSFTYENDLSKIKADIFFDPFVDKTSPSKYSNLEYNATK